MGFYLRKALRVGPLRFNLSKSGIGVSAGIPGFRIGTGPRGNYVHMGRGGFYFRKTLNPSRPGGSSSTDSTEPPIPIEARATTTPLEEIDSASVLQLTNASSSDLLAELDQKRRLIRFLPLALTVGSIAVGAAAAVGAPPWVSIALVSLTLAGAWYAHQKDQLRKTTVVFYDFDPESEQAYEGLHRAFEALRQTSALWHIGARGDVLDQKYHAGASKVVTRKGIAVMVGEPPLLRTNVSVPMLPAGRQTIAFLPDRALVFEAAGVGAVSYGELMVEASETQFIEEEAQPHDALVVGRTWRYVNKKGGPDRRFAHNPELPILRYGELSLRSASGLNELFQASTVPPLKELASALGAMAGAASNNERKADRPTA